MLSDGNESNDGETSSGPLPTMKKRRIQRACDICRKKRIRCDGKEMPGKSCSKCISCKSECTYVEASQKRSLPKWHVTYVKSLKNTLSKSENRVDKLEKLLRQLCPDETLFKELCASLDANCTMECPSTSDIAIQVQPDISDLGTVSSAIRAAMEGDSDTSRSSIDHNNDDSRRGTLIQLASELKKEYTGDDEGLFGVPEVVKNQRAEPGEMKPWEQESYETPSPGYDFPDVDLSLLCADLYFKLSNLYLPLLHRPTFDKDVQEGLHHNNEGFASVFLLVCAVGARFSDDPRVLLDGEDIHSSGWKWFKQVEIMKRPPLSPPSLYDLQIYCLSAQYLLGTSSPQSYWIMVGTGIRLAQAVGAHRRKVHKPTHTAEDELWKRAFWVLVCMDRTSSSALGLSCAIQDVDFDLDLPADCDDEYWDNPDPEKCFKQPQNKPSLVRGFISYIKLTEILGLALRTIYSIDKPKTLPGYVGQSREQHIVAELDAALNKWVDLLPDYLRWDPSRENNNFFNQSASLYVAYYDIQIYIHRPFIPPPSKPSPLTFPSLAICTNAARASSLVLESIMKRNPNPPPHIQVSALTVGIVLLINIWVEKRSGFSTGPHKEMAGVHKCMELLKAAAARWYPAGGLWGILCELACAGALPLPQPGPPSMKRARESDIPFPPSANDPPSDPMSNKISRAIAGSRRVPEEFSFLFQTRQSLREPLPQHLPPQLTPPPAATHGYESDLPYSQQAPLVNTMFALPVYTKELGMFPLREQVAIGAQTHQSRLQTHSPQLHPQTNHWYTMPSSASTQGGGRSEPTDSSGFNSYWFDHPPASALQQQQVHLNHTSQNIPSSGLSMEQGLYETDVTPVATGIMFEPTTHAQQQQTSTYSVGSSSTLPQSSSGLSIENEHGGMGTGMRPDVTGEHSLYQHQHQYQGFLQQQQEQPLTDTFVDESDVWWNTLAALGLSTDCLPAYLANLSEFKRGH